MKSQIFDVQKGQVVWLWPTGDNAYRGRKERYSKGVITKVGRKYIYVHIYGCLEQCDERFFKEDFSLDCDRNPDAGYLIYQTEEDLLNDEKYSKMLKAIRRCMLSFDIEFDMDEIQQIHAILEKYKHV